MAIEQSDLLLNADEFKLLNELFGNGEESSSQKVEYDLSAYRGGEELLVKLGMAKNLQFVADYDDYHLVFPIKIKKGDFTTFTMQFKSPEILEGEGKLRSWRLPAEKNLRLVTENGEEADYQIKDISASGISLRRNQRTQFPVLLQNMYLLLPNKQRLVISGAHVMRVDDNAVAYSLDNIADQQTLESLSEYLYQCHVQLYPEAYQ